MPDLIQVDHEYINREVRRLAKIDEVDEEDAANETTLYIS